MFKFIQTIIFMIIYYSIIFTQLLNYSLYYKRIIPNKIKIFDNPKKLPFPSA